MNTTLQNHIDVQTLQTRYVPRERDANDPRGYFFRDATAIMHSDPFRRLKHKTQVFFAPSNDHICTRLEHVLHVSSIAVTICKALGLDTDMAWAIGLGHDLGHTPFGHLGETVLCRLTGRHFCHELHSLRVVDKLSKLNLTYGVRDGIVTHCGEKFEKHIEPTHRVEKVEEYTDRTHYSASFEGCVVRVSDKIAYLGRDYEDAVTLGIIDIDDMPFPVKRALGGSDNSNIINTFTLDVIKYAKQHGAIGFTEEIHEGLDVLKEYNYINIYKSDDLIIQSKRFEKLLEIVYDILYESIEKYKDDLDAYEETEYPIVKNFKRHLINHQNLYTLSDSDSRIDALIDYIAGMTDDYVISTVKKSLFPNSNISKL